MKVVESLNRALHAAMSGDERVLFLGEDVLDPYGGAFKVSAGLSTAYPSRVLTTPVSEAGIVGVAAGMALRGFRPVVEIMFGDFMTLAADQLLNHAAKFRAMYHDQVRVPLVVRTPMGGRRGYGPTHSQTLEKLFLGTPGLRVLSVTSIGDPGALLTHAIADDDPVLVVENKLLYAVEVWDARSDRDLTCVAEGAGAPTYRIAIANGGDPVVTLAAHGYAAELARQAVVRLAYEREVFAELIVPTQLSPFALDAVVTSGSRTGAVLAVEEGTRALGWGAEVVAAVSEAAPRPLRIARVAALDVVLPAALHAEEACMPSVDDIVKAAAQLVGGDG